MKIFNWVHRRFNNKGEIGKKNGESAAENEQFPAENKCDDVFERLRGGILAIGTFGYNPEHLTNGYVLEEVDDDHSSVKDQRDDNGDDDERNPLVLVTHAEELTQTEENLNQLPFGFEYVMVQKKERTTLADLFIADSDQDQRAIAKFNKSDLLREKSSRKHAPSFGKKLTAKDAPRPVHKLNKLIRRMLRRKIHPDVGPINPKVVAVNNNNKFRATDDYASLLPTQDTNM